MWEYDVRMARLATTTDVFNAVAEPQRRRILALLVDGEQSVNQIAEQLGDRQPQASKHLAVLKAVGLVTVRTQGRQHLYRANPEGLLPIYNWVKSFEQLWRDRCDRLDDYLQQLQGKSKS